MAKPQARIGLLQFFLALAVLAIVGRAVQVQLVQGADWAREAVKNRTRHEVLPARRGAIADRNGTPLAVTQEFYRVGVAPNEVNDAGAVAGAVARQLGVSAARVRRDLRRGERYLYFHGPFSATTVEPLRGLAGVHLEGFYSRFWPSRDLFAPFLGGLGDDGHGSSGLELSLDSILAGVPGEAVVLRDNRGRRYDSPSRVVREPVPGLDVILTIDAELQDIAERSLEEAVVRLEAEGGDVVFLDPHTGEILALASRRMDQGRPVPRSSVLTDPFEPGSTAKLFTAAGLLSHERVDSTTAFYAERGRWRRPIRQTPRGDADYWTIDDSEAEAGELTLAQAIEVSSNIVMAKFSDLLSSEEQYETLRGFGFGSPTGVEYPSESAGLLDRPHLWNPLFTRASLAMGYRFAVTPLQLAVAYAAIANDGIVLSPSLVREIRDETGASLYRHQPEPVRRAISPAVARQLRLYLGRSAGAHGTGSRAQLTDYQVLGKTGTAKVVENGRYVDGKYNASFAAIFPADDPQVVMIVKIDAPHGGRYYASQTAVPVTRRMLEQALAARHVAIDRARLPSRRPVRDSLVEKAVPVEATPMPPAAMVVVAWPRAPEESPAAVALPVPSLKGVSVREAVLALHRRGFRVTLKGSGRVVRSEPAAGTSYAEGRTVTIWAEP